MNISKALKSIDKQIIQIESLLWELDFETPFRLKRLIGDEWELLSWKPVIGRYRLTYTRIGSFELSGGVPDIEIPAAEASDEIKLKIGPYLENFIMRYQEIAKNLEKQTEKVESFNLYLADLREKISESGKEIRRAANDTQL